MSFPSPSSAMRDVTVLVSSAETWMLAWVLLVGSVLVFGPISRYYVKSASCKSHNEEKDGSTKGVFPVSGLWESFRGFGSEWPWFMAEMAEKLGWPPAYNLPFTNFYVVAGGKLAREILHDSLSDKPRSVLKAMDPLFGGPGMSLISNSDRARGLRKGIAPAFSTNEIKRTNDVCRKHVEEWIGEILVPMNEKGGTFDPTKEMLRITSRVMLEAMLEYDATDDEINDFVRNFRIASIEFGQRQTNPIRRMVGIFIPEVHRAFAASRRIQVFAKRIMDSYRSKGEDERAPNKTVIRLILESPHLVSDEERVTEIIHSFVAGYETTAYTISNTLIHLAKHPDVCKKLREDIEKCGAGSNSPYFQHFIRESARLCPVSPLVTCLALGRDHTFDWPERDGPSRSYKIPKGSFELLVQHAINYNAKVFTDPDRFDPSRWEGPNVSTEMKASVITFSSGSRSCLGQALAVAEIDAVLSRLVREYDFAIEEEGEVKLEMLIKTVGARLKAKRVK